METKQTAVEWLVEQYANENYGIEVYEQAKAMEKEQIKHALMVGISIGFDDNPEYISEKFYNQTYGN